MILSVLSFPLPPSALYTIIGERGLPCLLPLIVFPFPPAQFPLGSPCLSCPWGKGQQGSMLLWEGGRGGGGGRRGLIAPCPLLPLEEEHPGSRGLLVGVVVLGAGGFGHLLGLAHISQSVA